MGRATGTKFWVGLHLSHPAGQTVWREMGIKKICLKANALLSLTWFQKNFLPDKMNYYAHTATLPDGANDPNMERWQLLSAHLRNVADLAEKFAVPFNLAEEAKLAGLLHDLGKYADRFQARLRNPTIHGINHWAAGAFYAGSTLKQLLTAFAIDGHHTGIPSLDGDGLKQTVARMREDKLREELTRCTESIADLLNRFAQDGFKLPIVPPRAIGKDMRFEEALRTRMLFSCLIDADRLDTEKHFNPKQGKQRIVPDLQPERALEILKNI